MRFCALFLLLAGTLAAETGFLTGQGARLIIGQETFTAMDPGASAKLLGGAGGVAFANDTLFVADANRLGATPINHRVLIFNNASQQFPDPTQELIQGGRCPACLGEANVVVGQPDFEEAEQVAPAADKLRVPVGLASNGVRLAVADTDNNRVLIWNSIPTTNGQPADLVLGQSSFDTNASNGFNPTPTSLRGPQGVWWQDGNLWVADTGNNRVLMFRNPSTSGQAADLVLGAPDFTTFVQSDLTQQDFVADAQSLQTPVSVSSDGQHLFVTDLGNNRILIWNSIPTANQQPANLAVGQPDLESRRSNNSPGVCDPAIVDDPETTTIDETTYPTRCSATLDFPRYALSDGQRLFVADGGNDRVLVFDQIPTGNGAHADAVIGQVNEYVNNTSDQAFPDDIASAGVVRTPTSLAWDGLNLYVADPFNRRVLIFTEAERRIANTGVRNAASYEIFASGTIALSGEFAEGDEITVKIENERDYTYTVGPEDTIQDIVLGIVNAINAGEGDPDVLATGNPAFFTVILTARSAGDIGNSIEFAVTTPESGLVTADTSGSFLTGGEEATKIAPYTIVSIVGDDLADQTVSADMNADKLPRSLGGVQVYFDGIRSPILYVSPTQINAQMPSEVYDAQSVNAYIRSVRADGQIVASNVVPVPIIQYNPGIFAADGPDPRPAIALHSSSNATGVISVDGSATAGDEAIVIINGRRYTYTVTEDDANAGQDLCAEGVDICLEKTLAGLTRIMDGLIDLINQDPEVNAFAATSRFQRIRLVAKVEGPAGYDISFGTETSDSANLILTASGVDLCCANEAGAVINQMNPAVPGEIVRVWATGLGLVVPEVERVLQSTGEKFTGTDANRPAEFVSANAGGITANVLACNIEPGTFGLYRCDLVLAGALPTNPLTSLTISQGFQISNIATIPVVDPNP